MSLLERDEQPVGGDDQRWVVCGGSVSELDVVESESVVAAEEPVAAVRTVEVGTHVVDSAGLAAFVAFAASQDEAARAFASAGVGAG